MTKCLACALNPNITCQYCNSKYRFDKDHKECVQSTRHVFGLCANCMCDQCEGRVPLYGQDIDTVDA